MTVKNLHLRLSSPETTATLLPFTPSTMNIRPVLIDTPEQVGAIMVTSGQETAARIIACVNSCNDIPNDHLEMAEVRNAIAFAIDQRNAALALLGKFAKNAFKIQHGSYDLQGHEDFDVEAVVTEAGEMVAKFDALNAEAELWRVQGEGMNHDTNR